MPDAVTLDDKYLLESGRVYLTGTQALVRLPMMQRQRDLAAGLQGVVVKEDTRDAGIWLEYLENVMKKRGDWQALYAACKELAE